MHGLYPCKTKVTTTLTGKAWNCFPPALSHESDKKKLLKEVTTMLSFKHPNVMSLIGMCFDGEMPLLIMPYMSHDSVLVHVKQNVRELLLVMKRYVYPMIYGFYFAHRKHNIVI